MGRTYRVSRDSVYTQLWAVQCWRWWWPFWTEEFGMLNSPSKAEAMIDILRMNFK
jgi:hypothetical protein